MTCPFGEVRQLGFISHDIDASMRYFIDAWGIGPWYILRNLKGVLRYHGQRVELDMSVAMANNGEMQFEIVSQHNDVRSMYTDTLARTPGLHLQHLAVWSEDVAAIEAEAQARGWQAFFESESGPGRSVFIAHPEAPDVCVEISDCDPFKQRVRDTIRKIAASWDGSDPVREGLPG